MTIATFHIYGTKAYRSEIALYRAEGVSAAEAEQFQAPATTVELYRVDGGNGWRFCLGMIEALRIFAATKAHRMASVAVVG